MKIISIIAAAALASVPSAAWAGPGQSGPASPQMHPPATPNSPTGNGGGYNHMNSPQHATGQPMQSCETSGTTPGHSASAPGSAFNPNGNAGTHYAGSAPQNSRNTASVSQYDVACSNQPH